MLTDIFAIRYENVPIFKAFARREQRVLHQAFTILDDLHPFWAQEEDEKKESEEFWKETHKRTANELGLRWLSQPLYDAEAGLGKYQRTEKRKRAEIEICRNWYQLFPTSEESIDEYIKARLSLIEVGLRRVYEKLERKKEWLSELDPNFHGSFLGSVKTREKAYVESASELNLRFKNAHFPLHYHNGFIQLLRDDQISAQIEQPFWSAVSDPLWENVDLDMKEALDQRDTNGKDPAIHAGRALESTIKIISKGLGVTHGGEKGAHNYIDNISKKTLAFLQPWERDLLKDYFTKVRNPLGHGPGDEPMPILTYEQSSWAIETAMSWVKLLVDRYNQQMVKEGTQ